MFTTPLVFVAVSVTIPRPSPAVADTAHSWHELSTMAEMLAIHDPFHLPHEKDEMCGGIRSLRSIPKLFTVQPLLDDWYTIHDDVVMDYWESRDDVLWWTPIAACRADLVEVGL
jgi:hypothetical protein